ncbi:hypothetical protein [Lonepinella sp. BR2271]|uniref:hypothetical protein n=1 Tax=Lonepinella sp. BR2271 TaxID=3434550 RepID=UPI003F6DB3E5
MTTSGKLNPHQLGQTATTNNPTENDVLLEQEFALLFNLGRSIRYHTARRRFYDFCDKMTNVLSLLFSSTTIYGVLQTGSERIALYSGALVSIASAFSLVIGFSSKARDHLDFTKQYINLERKLRRESLSDELIKHITDEKLSIEANEPPIITTLNQLCYNAEVRAQGISENKLIKVSFINKLFRHFF